MNFFPFLSLQSQYSHLSALKNAFLSLTSRIIYSANQYIFSVPELWDSYLTRRMTLFLTTCQEFLFEKFRFGEKGIWFRGVRLSSGAQPPVKPTHGSRLTDEHNPSLCCLLDALSLRSLAGFPAIDWVVEGGAPAVDVACRSQLMDASSRVSNLQLKEHSPLPNFAFSLVVARIWYHTYVEEFDLLVCHTS